MNHLNNIIIQELLDDNLTGLEREAAMSHLAECEKCACAFAKLKILDGALRSESLETTSMRFVDEVMKRIDAIVYPAPAKTTNKYWSYFANIIALLILAGIIYSSNIIMREYTPSRSTQVSPTNIIPENRQVHQYAKTIWDSITSGTQIVVSIFSSKNPFSFWLIAIFALCGIFIVDWLVGRRILHLRM